MIFLTGRGGRLVAALAALGLLFAAGCSITDPFGKSAQLQDHLKAGRVSFMERRFEPASREFEAALAMNAAQPMVWTYLGICRLELQDLPRSVEALEKAIQLDPKSAEALYYLGRAYRLGGRLPEAVSTLEKALSHGHRTGQMLLELGICLYLQGETTRAEPILKEVREKQPDLFLAAFYLGEIWRRAGRLPEAKEILQEAVKIDGKSPFARFALGEILVELGQLDLAREEFSKILSDETPFARTGRAYFQLGYIDYQQGKHASALELFRLARLASYEQETCRLWEAKALYRLGKNDESRTLLEALAPSRAKLPQVDYYLARIHLSEGNGKEALEALERVEDRSLDPAEIDSARGSIRLMELKANHLVGVVPQDLVNESLSAYTRALAVRENQPEALMGLTQLVYLFQEDYKVAASYLARLAKTTRGPEVEEWLFYTSARTGDLATAYPLLAATRAPKFLEAAMLAHEKKWQEAEEKLVEGFSEDDKELAARTMQAVLYVKTERRAKAVEILRKMLDIHWPSAVNRCRVPEAPLIVWLTREESASAWRLTGQPLFDWLVKRQKSAFESLAELDTSVLRMVGVVEGIVLGRLENRLTADELKKLEIAAIKIMERLG